MDLGPFIDALLSGGTSFLAGREQSRRNEEERGRKKTIQGREDDLYKLEYQKALLGLQEAQRNAFEPRKPNRSIYSTGRGLYESVDGASPTLVPGSEPIDREPYRQPDRPYRASVNGMTGEFGTQAEADAFFQRYKEEGPASKEEKALVEGQDPAAREVEDTILELMGSGEGDRPLAQAPDKKALERSDLGYGKGGAWDRLLVENKLRRDIRVEHPEWSPVQIEREVKKRVLAASGS